MEPTLTEIMQQLEAEYNKLLAETDLRLNQTGHGAVEKALVSSESARHAAALLGRAFNTLIRHMIERDANNLVSLPATPPMDGEIPVTKSEQISTSR